MNSLHALVRQTSRRRLLIFVVVIVVAVVALAFIANREPRISSSEERRVRTLVERFGSRLKQVGLQGPRVKHEITTVFANLVTAELLDSWLANPSQVPARTTSSPWPDRIEVRDITKMPIATTR